MSKKIQTKQLNIEIDEMLLHRAKSQAYAEGKKLYQWMADAIQSKLEQTDAVLSGKTQIDKSLFKEKICRE